MHMSDRRSHSQGAMLESSSDGMAAQNRQGTFDRMTAAHKLPQYP